MRRKCFYNLGKGKLREKIDEKMQKCPSKLFLETIAEVFETERENLTAINLKWLMRFRAPKRSDGFSKP
jgi:hypothetical protein